MRNSKMLLCLGVGALCSVILTGCSGVSTTAAGRKAQNSVLTAFPNEVVGCRFIGNVENAPRYTIETARYDLKILANEMGATHIVEEKAYPERINRLTYDTGVTITARAYICPNGVGSTTNNSRAEAKLNRDLPHPEVNSDDSYFDTYVDTFYDYNEPSLL